MTYIKKEDLIIGHPYLVKARNFTYAIWTGEDFVGVRYKFGSYFIDTEQHWDDGPPHGTVKPLKDLSMSEEDAREEYMRFLTAGAQEA